MNRNRQDARASNRTHTTQSFGKKNTTYWKLQRFWFEIQIFLNKWKTYSTWYNENDLEQSHEHFSLVLRQLACHFFLMTFLISGISYALANVHVICLSVSNQIKIEHSEKRMLAIVYFDSIVVKADDISWESRINHVFYLINILRKSCYSRLDRVKFQFFDYIPALKHISRWFYLWWLLVCNV